jgi:hypothetical protein
MTDYLATLGAVALVLGVMFAVFCLLRALALLTMDSRAGEFFHWASLVVTPLAGAVVTVWLLREWS